MAKHFVTNYRGEFVTPEPKLVVKAEPMTPQEEDFGDHHQLHQMNDSFEVGVKMRKSFSMNDIAAFNEDHGSLDSNMHNKGDYLYGRNRRQTGAPLELSKTKFVSMAEAIYHYERDTPGRFHSTRPQKFQPQGYRGPTGLTVPQSPMLRCKARSRPQYVISQKEKEEQELEEIRKHKIKAHPVPKSVIEGSHLPDVPRKPITVPEPFHLTEIHKKPHESPEQMHFKARPAPKHILEKPHVPPKPAVPITIPVSPKFHYNRAKSDDHLKHDNKKAPTPISRQKSAGTPAQKVQRHGPIRPEPFSFEKRDEQMKIRREERIKQQIEEERKQASAFKAQPVPGVIRKRICSVTGKEKISTSSTTSSENKENHFKFEARPPVVLKKEPFKPVYRSTEVLKPMPFQLASEKRAVKRAEFDKLLKEKEEEQEKYRKQIEREYQEAEKNEKAEMRAKLVHHPKPVPVAIKNPYVPEKSVAPLTVPETPKFVRRLKENKRN